ncbi:MAG: ABC transporter permease, partial [Acidobacteriaceae bacterium]|nr:ABC transporter permease [Acidobacteriaceae bacterium]
AYKNSIRNKRRSILTIASIAVSLCLLGVLIAIYHALYFSEATPGQALRLIVRHKVSLAQAFPSAYEQKIRQVPGVVEISPWNWYGGTYKDNRDPKNFFARFGVDPARFLKIRTQLVMPEDERQAFIHERTACVIARDLAEKLGIKLGDRVTLDGDIYPGKLELNVRGIFDDPDAQTSLFFNMEYLRESQPLGRRGWDSTVAVLADSPQDVPRIAAAVDKIFENSSAPTKTESEQQFTLSFVAFLGNVKLFLLSICGAVTFTILLVSGNTMAMSVRERIKEVGVLKTLGFTNEAVLGIILGEAVTISLIGGAIGLVLASVLCVGVGKAGSAFVAQLRGLSLTPATILISLGIAAMIGLVSAFIPALNAARTKILDSLRYAG